MFNNRGVCIVYVPMIFTQLAKIVAPVGVEIGNTYVYIQNSLPKYAVPFIMQPDP